MQFLIEEALIYALDLREGREVEEHDAAAALERAVADTKAELHRVLSGGAS